LWDDKLKCNQYVAFVAGGIFVDDDDGQEYDVGQGFRSLCKVLKEKVIAGLGTEPPLTYEGHLQGQNLYGSN